MTDHHHRPIEVEHDVGHGADAVMKALGLSEAEDLADPLGGETRVFVREHRDHALLSHSRPPCIRNK